MSAFHKLRIKEVIRETQQAVSLSFEIPTSLENEFKFEAGQYITIKTNIDGKELRRAYSLCSTPTSEEFKVTVKEVEGGKFSVLANNKLQAGDFLEVHPPEGKFKLTPSETPKTYAAFAAGSGITPVLSMLKTVLNQEQHSKFILTYGNKSPEETIFFKDLLELQANYPDRLFIEFIFSRSREDNAQFGRIETSTINYVLKNKFKSHAIDAYYLCGPEAMIDTIIDVLDKNGIEKDVIFYELFTSSNTGQIEANLEGKSEISITIDDEETSFIMNQNEVILDVALNRDLDIPYSCQGGICSSCIARVVEGKAKMIKNQILTDDEIEEGLILTCQAHPITPSIKLDFDDV